MKTLAEIRDELAEEYFPTFGSGAFTQGFDAGAKAVMEQAQKLVEALEKCGISHTPLCTSVGCYKSCVELKRKNALKEWQGFVGVKK